MRIAIDFSPLTSGHYLKHRVRGTGFYLRNLKESLLRYFPENSYTFFSEGGGIPKEIDIVHYPYFEPFFVTLPFKSRKKTVVTVHDLIPLRFPKFFPKGLKGSLKWQIQKFALKNADAVITDSENSKNDILKFVGLRKDKVHVVYLAPSENFGNPAPRQVLKETKEKFNLPDRFLLYVGDATWNKNLPSLIRAVGKTSYYLVIVGEAFSKRDFDRKNPWNKSLSEAQNLADLNKRVLVTGFVSDQELGAIYELAQSLIMPSFYEGFGLPVLEAMSSGCPVITSKEGSLKEIAGDTAFFVDPYSISSISNGIETVMSDKALRSDLSERGSKQADKFSWRNTAGETLQVYKKVLDE